MAMKNSILVALFLGMTTTAAAQWYNYPTPGIPRTPDGKPNLSAPAPRTADGKPDISGLWRSNPTYYRNLAADLKPDQVVYQPWADTLHKERQANNSKDHPTASCLVGGVPRANLIPYPFKIIQTPGLVVMLYEAVHSYRQIFTDGRPFPEDPDPSWYGYSVGRWEGDTLVIETRGFKDRGWLDASGRPASDNLRVIERFRRKDFGHMDLEVTIDDPKTYTKPWTVTLPFTFAADTELGEFMCNENNQYSELVK
jgi:hypothetical protein